MAARPHRLAGTLLALLAPLPPLWATTPDDYAGDGFVRVLADHTPASAPARAVAVGRLGGSSLPDVAMLLGDAVVVELDAAERGAQIVVRERASAIAVVAHAAGDVLYSADADELVRHDWDGASFRATAVGAGWGGGFLRAVRTQSGDPGLAVVAADGSTLHLLRYRDGAWEQAAATTADAAQERFHAADVADHDDDGVLDTVVVTESAVEVLGHGPVALVVGCTARLAVLPREAAAAGRDLLVVHGSVGGAWTTLALHAGGGWPLALGGSGGPDGLLAPAWSAGAPGERVGALVLADWLGNDGLPELVLSVRDRRELRVLEQRALPPYLVEPSVGASRVDLGKARLRPGCAPPAAAAPVAAGDLDEDGTGGGPGDVDLVLVTTCNELVVLPQEAPGLELRPVVPASPAPIVLEEPRRLHWETAVEVPPGTDRLEITVFRQPDPRAPASPLIEAPIALPVPGGPVPLDLTVDAPWVSATEVFQLQLRAEAGGVPFPPTTVSWSPNPWILAGLRLEEPLVFPWRAAATSEGPGGTVGRPRIDPIVVTSDS